MIVECISNRPDSIKNDVQRSHLNNYVHREEVDLQRGKKYIVYGIVFRNGFPWFYVCEDDDLSSLRPHFSKFFKLVDPSIPSVWQYCDTGYSEFGAAFLPVEWVRFPSFYEQLIDGNDEALEVLFRIHEQLLQGVTSG